MLAYGFSNAQSKPLSQKFGSENLLFCRGITVSLVLAIASIPALKHSYPLIAVLACIILGVAGYIPVLAFTHAIKTSRLGVVAPIAGTAPLVTVLLAFLFLNTPINPVQWLAICMVIFANLTVSINFKNWQESNVLQLSSGIPFAIMAALGWGLFYFFLIPSTKALGPWLSACLAEIGVTLAAGFHIWTKQKTLPIKASFDPGVVVNAFLLCIGTVAYTIGVDYYSIGIVAALSNSTAVISTLIGCFIFNEQLHAKEKIAAAIMITGITIICLNQGS
jgi:drug/metabolite transporter (DMT)-like permease